MILIKNFIEIDLMSIHTLVNLPKDLGDCFLCIPAIKKILSYCQENGLQVAFTGTARAHGWCEELGKIDLPLLQEQQKLGIEAIINLNFYDDSLKDVYPSAAFFQPEKLEIYVHDTEKFGKGAIVGKKRITWLVEDCLKEAGILDWNASLPNPVLPPVFTEEQNVKTVIEKFSLGDKKYAVIIPGCAPDRPMKMWPEEKFVELGKAFLAKGIQPLIIGGPAEKVLGERLEVAIGGSSRCIVGQTTLRDIGALAKGAIFCIGNDTGPTHLAASANPNRVFVFFGYYNDIETWRPYNSLPLLGKPKLQDITVDSVLKAINRTIEVKRILRPRQSPKNTL